MPVDQYSHITHSNNLFRFSSYSSININNSLKIFKYNQLILDLCSKFNKFRIKNFRYSVLSVISIIEIYRNISRPYLILNIEPIFDFVSAVFVQILIALRQAA